MIGRTRWRFREIDSTQRAAFDLARESAPHGTVIRADFQSAGRGRQGRTWQAPTGSSLMFSVILRPELGLHDLGTASILTASVLADVFATMTAQPVHIKWPNDVLIGGRKVSGILMQTRTSPEPVAVLGIGINIHIPAEPLPVNATYLAQNRDLPVDTDEVFERVLTGLESMWRGLTPDLGREHVESLNSRLWLLDEQVTLLDGEREISGRILGVAENGGLRLKDGDAERVIVAGEITRGPRLNSHS